MPFFCGSSKKGVSTHLVIMFMVGIKSSAEESTTVHEERRVWCDLQEVLQATDARGSRRSADRQEVAARTGGVIWQRAWDDNGPRSRETDRRTAWCKWERIGWRRTSTAGGHLLPPASRGTDNEHSTTNVGKTDTLISASVLGWERYWTGWPSTLTAGIPYARSDDPLVETWHDKNHAKYLSKDNTHLHPPLGEQRLASCGQGRLETSRAAFLYCGKYNSQGSRTEPNLH